MNGEQLYQLMKRDWTQRARSPLEYGVFRMNLSALRSSGGGRATAEPPLLVTAWLVWGRRVSALYVAETCDQVAALAPRAILPDAWPVRVRPVNNPWRVQHVAEIVNAHRFRPAAAAGAPGGGGTPHPT